MSAGFEPIRSGEVCAGCGQPLLADGNCPAADNCPVGARMRSIQELARGNRARHPKEFQQKETGRRVLPPGDRE